MIDIHSHILPGVDDGAADLDQAMAMCNLAAASGCDAIIATPHQRHPTWWNTEPVKLELLLEKVKRAVGDGLAIYLGAEVRVDRAFLAQLDRLEQAGVTPMAGSSYLLIEFQRRRIDVDPLAVVRAAHRAGWRPIIAHPELIDALSDDTGQIRELVAAGALLQITAMSVTGSFGRDIQDRALHLIDVDLAHFVASDAHGLHHRPPGLIKAQAAIVSRWGHIVANRLLVENPRAVIEDRPVAVPAVGSAAPRAPHIEPCA